MTTYQKRIGKILYRTLFLGLFVFFTACATEEIEGEEQTVYAPELAQKEPTYSTTAPSKGKSYFIRNKKSGKFLDLKNWGRYDENNVHQWGFTGDNNQIWMLENFDGNVRLRCKENLKSLELHRGSGNNGTNIIVGSTGNTEKQKFVLSPKSKGSKQFYIVNMASRKPFDVAHRSSDNGANVHQWAYANKNYENQLWEFFPIESYFKSR